jgi:hypothetical protein
VTSLLGIGAGLKPREVGLVVSRKLAEPLTGIWSASHDGLTSLQGRQRVSIRLRRATGSRTDVCTRFYPEMIVRDFDLGEWRVRHPEFTPPVGDVLLFASGSAHTVEVLPDAAPQVPPGVGRSTFAEFVEQLTDSTLPNVARLASPDGALELPASWILHNFINLVHWTVAVDRIDIARRLVRQRVEALNAYQLASFKMGVRASGEPAPYAWDDLNRADGFRIGLMARHGIPVAKLG